MPWVRTIVARFAADPVVGMWEPVKGATEVEKTLVHEWGHMLDNTLGPDTSNW